MMHYDPINKAKKSLYFQKGIVPWLFIGSCCNNISLKDIILM